MDRLFFALGALFCLFAVAAGAFGAHWLGSRLDAKALTTFETAARYQVYHGLGLIVAAWALRQWPGPGGLVAGYAFTAGIVLFCGSLYALSFGSPRILGAVAPLGGLGFMVGWGSLALAALLSKP